MVIYLFIYLSIYLFIDREQTIESESNCPVEAFKHMSTTIAARDRTTGEQGRRSGTKKTFLANIRNSLSGIEVHFTNLTSFKALFLKCEFLMGEL